MDYACEKLCQFMTGLSGDWKVSIHNFLYGVWTWCGNSTRLHLQQKESVTICKDNSNWI